MGGWHLLQANIGANVAVTLPSNFSEVHIKARYDLNSTKTYFYSMRFIKEDFENNNYSFIGFNNGSANGAQVQLSSNSITMLAYTFNGSDVSSSAKMSVYYR